MHNTELLALAHQLQHRIAAAPDDLDAQADLVAVLAQLGQTQQALSMLLPIAQQHPAHLGLQHNLAEIYRNTGELQKAEAIFLTLIKDHPYFLPPYQSLILILSTYLTVAHLTQQQRTEILSQLAIISNNKGNVLVKAGQLEAAQAAYIEALKYWPDYPSAHCNLSSLFRIVGQVGEAETRARTALRLNPNFAEAWNNLGMALSEQGRFSEAINCYQQALVINPALPEARHNVGSSRLFFQLFQDDLTALQIVEAHRQWGQQFETVFPPQIITSSDKLRIGFISADFREHPVMYFAEGLLEKLDRLQFEVVCYANQTIEDAYTLRIKALPLLWRPVAHLSDAALCAQIKQDQVQILIDLSGHMNGHRLYALAQKPAPIIATWMGYLFTTGLPSIDYRITDRNSDPETYASEQHIEQLIYLTHSQFNYRPKLDSPEVSTLPALHNGFITFGSLNNIHKLNRSVVSIWSKILLSIPNSRLLLQTRLLTDAGVAGRIRGLFEAFGVDAQRLELRPASNECFKTYHDIDIALDPFPFNGVTTTCEALWMGVPVLSLVGNRSVSRMGESILSTLDLTSWLAYSADEYIELALQHSSCLDSLVALRKGLRKQFTDSSLSDAESFAIDFSRCLKLMIQQKNTAS